MNNQPNTNLALLYAVLGFAAFLAVSIEMIKECRLRHKAKKWHGAAVGAITEIKEDYRYRRFFHKEWFEYPVLAYTVDHTSYCRPYPRKKEGIGYYELGQKIPLVYNQDNPEEFVFTEEFSGFIYYIFQLLTLAFAVFCLCLFTRNFKDYYLGTHELLFEQETWTDLEASFSDYKDRESFDYYDEIHQDTEEAIAHFQRLDAMIEKKQGVKNYDAYRSQYHQSADMVSESLSEAFSGIVGTFYEKCGLEGEKEKIYRSAYAGFLKEVNPAACDEAGYYSLEELYFLADLTDFSILHGQEGRDDPEESIGLSLAVCKVKVDTAMDLLAFGDSIKETMDRWFPNYTRLYMDRVNEYLLDNEEPPLDRNAVLSVYKYVTSEYSDTGSFEKTLWNGSIYAQDQLAARLEAQPDLQNVRRFSVDNNPFSSFRPEEGMEVFLTSTHYEKTRTPRHYLDTWNYFIEKIREDRRLDYWFFLP